MLTANVDQANVSTTPSLPAAKEAIVVSHNMQENQWLEISITDGIRKLNVSVSHKEYLLMVKGRFQAGSLHKAVQKGPLEGCGPCPLSTGGQRTK